MANSFNKTIVKNCKGLRDDEKICGKTFSIKFNEQREFLDLCDKCSEKQVYNINNIQTTNNEYNITEDIIKICKLCKKQFTITKGEQKFFLSHNLHIPSKCFICRDKIKKDNQVNNWFS